MIFGAILFVSGMALTLGTYAVAASGWGNGTYLLAWGAIGWGAYQFLSGWTERKGRTMCEEAYAEFELAADYEARGQVREALLGYRRIVENFPGSDAAHDAEKSIQSLLAR